MFGRRKRTATRAEIMIRLEQAVIDQRDVTRRLSTAIAVEREAAIELDRAVEALRRATA